MDRERVATVTKKGPDVVETNQLHPRPLLTCFHSSRTNLYLYHHFHLNEERPAYDHLIHRGGVILMPGTRATDNFIVKLSDKGIDSERTITFMRTERRFFDIPGCHLIINQLIGGC